MGKEIRKIKILRIIARLNMGGPAVHTILLTAGLNNLKFKSILVAGRLGKGEKDLISFAKNKSIYPIIIPELQREINLIDDLIAFFKIFALIRKEKPDIIHTHTAKAGTLGRLAGLSYNLFCGGNSKLIHTFHGAVFSGYFGRIKTQLFICIERILALFTDRIVAVTNTLKAELLRLKIGNPEKILVVPLGLETEELLSLPAAKPDRVFKVGIVGRLVPIKNHKMFLEAVKLFLESYSRAVKFFIIGDGELKEELENYASSLGIADFVEFQGWMQQSAEIYKLLDVVALTSLNEGTPLSLIEAMSAARPVIATDVGGVSDLFIGENNYAIVTSNRIKLFDNGILCHSRDSKGLAEGLNLLMEDQNLREKMGEAGRKFAREKFSKERLIRDIEMLYNTLLKRG